MAGTNHKGTNYHCSSRRQARLLLRDRKPEAVFKLVKRWSVDRQESPCFVCAYGDGGYGVVCRADHHRMVDQEVLCEEGVKIELDKIAEEVNPDYRINKIKDIIVDAETHIKTIKTNHSGTEAEVNEKVYAYERIKKEFKFGGRKSE